MGKKSGKKKSQFQIFFDENKNELTKALNLMKMIQLKSGLQK